MNREKIDLMEWQKDNLEEGEIGKIYGVPENPENKFKGVDEDGSEVDIPDKLEKDEATEELFLGKIDKSKKRERTVEDPNKKEGDSNDLKDRQFQIGKRRLAELKREQVGGTVEDKKINLENNREEATEKIVINGKDLEGQRQKIMEKLEKLGDEGYIDKDKQKELEEKLEEVETLMKKTGDKVKEKLVVLSKKEIAQEEVKVENYKANKISDLVEKINKRIALFKEQLEKEGDEDKKRMVENEIKVAEGKLEIYEKKFNKLGKDLTNEEISEEMGGSRKKIKEGIKERIIKGTENDSTEDLSIKDQLKDIPNEEAFKDIMKRERGINYELDNEQFDKMKLFLGESGEGRWLKAYTSLNEVAGEDLQLPYHFGTLGFVNKQNDNIIVIEAFNGREKFKIKVEFDFDKKGINVNVVEKTLKKTETPEAPEAPEPDIKPEKEREPKNVEEIVEKLGEYAWGLQEEIADISKGNKGKLEDYNMGKEQSEEDEKTAKGIIKLENMSTKATLTELSAEIAASPFEKNPRKRREAAEAVSADLDNLLKTLQAKILTQQKESARRELGGERNKILRNFVNVSEKRTKKAVSKNKKDNQQTREPKDGGRWKGLWNYVDKKINKNKNEEGEGEFDEVKFKEEVAVEFLKVLDTIGGDKISRFLKNAEDLDEEEEIKVVNEDHQKQIAEKLSVKYGKGPEELEKIIAGFGFEEEDIKKAIEAIKIAEIPEPKGFRDVVEAVENVEDLDGVIEYLEKIKKEASATKESKGRTDTFLNMIKSYKDNIASGDENKIKEVEEGLEKNMDNAERFALDFFNEDKLKKLFKKIGGLCEKEREKKDEDLKEIMEMISEERHDIGKVRKITDLMELLTSLLGYTSVVPLGGRPDGVAKIDWGIGHYLRNTNDAELPDLFLEMRNSAKNVTPQKLREYYEELIDKIEEMENSDDNREDSGEGESGEEIMGEMKEKIKEKINMLDDDEFKEFEEALRINKDNIIKRNSFSVSEFNAIFEKLEIEFEDVKFFRAKHLMEMVGDIYNENKGENKEDSKADFIVGEKVFVKRTNGIIEDKGNLVEIRQKENRLLKKIKKSKLIEMQREAGKSKNKGEIIENILKSVGKENWIKIQNEMGRIALSPGLLKMELLKFFDSQYVNRQSDKLKEEVKRMSDEMNDKELEILRNITLRDIMDAVLKKNRPFE